MSYSIGFLEVEMKRYIFNKIIIRSRSHGRRLFWYLFGKSRETITVRNGIIVKKEADSYGKRINNYSICGLLNNALDLKTGRLSKKIRAELKHKRSLIRASMCLSGSYFELITNSRKIHLKAYVSDYIHLDYITNMASSGVDVYVYEDDRKEEWIGCFTSHNVLADYINVQLKFTDQVMRRIRFYLPLFVPVIHIDVLVDKNALVLPTPKEKRKQVIIYGSSITQGCAASRPSLTYGALLGRRLNREIVNLGFSESAKGEIEIARFIGSLNPDMIVMEYDHNATYEELKNTHCKFYQELRNNNKDTIIVFLTRISGGISITKEEYEKRKRIILDTMKVAKDSNDNKTYFIDGTSLINDKERFEYLVDKKHPNDRGMSLIADKIIECFKGATV